MLRYAIFCQFQLSSIVKPFWYLGINLSCLLVYGGLEGGICCNWGCVFKWNGDCDSFEWKKRRWLLFSGLFVLWLLAYYHHSLLNRWWSTLARVAWNISSQCDTLIKKENRFSLPGSKKVFMRDFYTLLNFLVFWCHQYISLRHERFYANPPLLFSCIF